jgi:hypothetical protein
MHVRHSFEEKNGGMHMADQSLARRQTSEVVVQQRTPGRIVQQTEAKMQEARGVIVTAAQVYDDVHRDLEAMARQSGRSSAHQRYMEERLAYLRGSFDYTAGIVVRDGLFNITQSRPTEIVRTEYIPVPEPRRPWHHFLTGS